jgi:hypothetical protein
MADIRLAQIHVLLTWSYRPWGKDLKYLSFMTMDFWEIEEWDMRRERRRAK